MKHSRPAQGTAARPARSATALCPGRYRLRVSEACSLTRGHLDWREGRSIVLGKGDKEAVVRFSERSMHKLRAYLNARAELDGGQGKPLRSLPLFARHDRGAGKRVLGISERPIGPSLPRRV